MSFNVQHLRSSELNKRPLAGNMLEGELVINFNAGSPGLFFKDDAGTVVKVGPAHYGASAPNSSPAEGGSVGNSIGEFWYDTANGILKIYNGTGWEDLEAGLIQSISGTGAISVDDSDAANPVISVASASTETAGVVQLNDTRSSTATDEALTANQGRVLQEQIDALTVSNNLTLAGTFNATTGLMSTVTSAGSSAGFSVGSAGPAATAGNADYFVIVDVAGSNGISGVGSYDVGDWFLSNGTTWQFLNVGFKHSSASTTASGVVELATNTETQDGVSTTHAVTPAGLQSKLSDSVGSTSSFRIASSFAVKVTYDKALQAESDAADAQSTADAAYNAANTAASAAAAAQADATQALANGSTNSTAIAAAQADATQALADAAAAQADATQALDDVITAQSTAELAAQAAAAAQNDADIANATAIDAQTAAIAATDAAAAAQADATQALADAAAAQSDATQALSDAAAAQSSANAAQSDATQALLDASAAQATANAAIPKATVQAKGDIIVGTGSAAYTNLTVGSAGYVLVADPTEAAGVKWVSADAGTF